MANTYDKGDVVRCSATFSNSAGVSIDPAAVLFDFKTLAGATTTYTYGTDSELIKDDTGDYHVDLGANEEGVWYWRFYSTGTGQAAAEARFHVCDTKF